MPMEIKNPVFSIITPLLNAHSSILKNLESVYSQDFPCEHIIVDGGSTDGSLEIAETFATRFGTKERPVDLSSEPDKGIYDAMNRGINRASGTIIGILNADDVYAEGKTLSLVHDTFSMPGIDACYGDLRYISPKRGKICRVWKSSVHTPDSFLYGWMPPHPTFFLLRHHYINHGLYRLDLGTSADYELMLRMLHRHRLNSAYIPLTLINMTAGGASARSLTQRLSANSFDSKAWDLNGIHPLKRTRWLKPMRKIIQYIPALLHTPTDV